MNEKNLVLTEMGGGLPAKIRMDSFTAFTRSDLCKAGTAKYVVMFEGAGNPEDQLAIWIKEAEHHKLDYIPIRDPEDNTVLHGISIFSRPKVRNTKIEPELRVTTKKRVRRSTVSANMTKSEQLSKLKDDLRSKYPKKSRWAIGAKIGAMAASFFIIGILGTAIALIVIYPEQYQSCWDAGKSVYLPYLQQCMGWDYNG